MAEEGGASEGVIITSLCWVSRGYSAAMIQESEPTKEEILKYKKVGQ